MALFLSVRFLSQAGPPGALARFEVRGCRFTIKCLEERQGKAQITHIERAWSTHEGRKATIVASSGEVALAARCHRHTVWQIAASWISPKSDRLRRGSSDSHLETPASCGSQCGLRMRSLTAR